MSLLKRVIGGAAIGGVAIFAGTGAFDDETTRTEDGHIVESGGLGAFAMRVGDCVQLPDENSDQVASVEGVPCTEAHDAQVYAEFDLATAGFPSDADMDALGVQGCTERWAAAIGSAYEADTAFDFTFFSPTETSWAEDDREVTCMVISVDGSPLIGSKLVP